MSNIRGNNSIYRNCKSVSIATFCYNRGSKNEGIVNDVTELSLYEPLYTLKEADQKYLDSRW